MRGHPDRLVDHDEVVVVVHHMHPRNRLSNYSDGSHRTGQLNLEPRVGGEAVGLADGAAVELDGSAGRQFGGLGP
jgi:hypothetical protein